MINKLVEKIKKTKAPIVVGLDPMLSYIPQHVQEKAFAEYGETLEGAAEAIWQFNKAIIDFYFFNIQITCISPDKTSWNLTDITPVKTNFHGTIRIIQFYQELSGFIADHIHILYLEAIQ